MTCRDATTAGDPEERAEASLAAPTTVEVHPGDCVGRYTVRRLLGAGGMGQVFAAVDPDLGRTVALKLVRPERGGASPRARTRLLREAQALARLHHQNVVSVYDVGTDGDRVFLAMELVAGMTMTEWVGGGERRSWRAVRDRFVAAGRGLAAAHAAGIIHRDFKPRNVLVAGDRVVVVDFGLARAGTRAGPARGGGDDASELLGVSITLSGEWVGTPDYTAPEQLRGERCDARADQFAFCVALWEALHDERPFTGESHEQRLEAIAAGAVREPPRERRAPEWLREALVRGLAADPDARWPSMDALLAALGRDGRARRRRLIGLVGAAGLTALALAFAVGRHGVGGGRDLCGAGTGLAAEVWNDAARARVRAAFLATGLPYATDTFARVDAALTGELAGWAREHRAACEATHLRHEQSDALLDRRMQCLERTRRGAGVLVALLAEADGDTVDRAVAATGEAFHLERCADPARLAGVVPPPADPAQAAEAAAILDEAERMSRLFSVGRYAEVSAAGRVLLPRARAAGHAPALVAALLATIPSERQAGHVEEALRLLDEAVRAAEDAHDDAARAAALVTLVFCLGHDARRYDEADVIAPLARSAVRRAGSPLGLLRRLAEGEAAIAAAHGQHAAALVPILTAMMLAARTDGADSVVVARLLGECADEVRALGHPAEARRMLERALTTVEGQLGPEHPMVAMLLSRLGDAAGDAGDYQAAERALLRGIELRERLYGVDHYAVVPPLLSLASLHIAAGRLVEARELAERAERILATSPGAVTAPATVQETLAQIDAQEGKLDEALARHRRALALIERLDGPEHPYAAAILQQIGETEQQRGRFGEARAAFDRALAIRRKLYGDAHPLTASSLGDLGSLLLEQGHAAEALPLLERALAIEEQGSGPGAINLVAEQLVYVEALTAAGRPSQAIPVAERALAAATAGHLSPRLVSSLQLALARALLQSGRDRPRACSLLREARDTASGLAHAAWLPEIERALRRGGCR